MATEFPQEIQDAMRVINSGGGKKTKAEIALHNAAVDAAHALIEEYSSTHPEAKSALSNFLLMPYVGSPPQEGAGDYHTIPALPESTGTGLPRQPKTPRDLRTKIE